MKQRGLKPYLISLLGNAVISFGIYNIHSVSQVTEGGVIGLELLLFNLFGVSPSLSGPVLTVLCFAFGWRVLGNRFLNMSLFNAIAFSLCYALCEQLPPLMPGLAEYPLEAAVLGALFIGVGTGLCVRMGGASAGDDALAMALSAKLRVKIQWMYLASDVVVLALSLSYIPVKRIVWSLLTVILSGQIIGLIVRLGKENKT